MITYLKGDATNPQTKGPKIIIHICNDIGGWGKGFVLAISKKWKEPEIAYRKWYNERNKGNNFKLGEVQFIEVRSNLVIANMLCQRGTGSKDGTPPIRYDALEKCLEKVVQFSKNNCSLHMPRIGCGLAGGKWEKVEAILKKFNIEMFVYDF